MTDEALDHVSRGSSYGGRLSVGRVAAVLLMTAAMRQVQGALAPRGREPGGVSVQLAHHWHHLFRMLRHLRHHHDHDPKPTNLVTAQLST